MRIRSALTALAVVLAGLVAGAGNGAAATTTTATTTSPYCGITWGSAEKSAGALSSAPLVDVRTGRHDCYDRVVFEFAGPVDGYAVGYGETWTEGEGLVLSPYTAGGALLRVSLRAPAYDDSRLGTVPYRVGSGCRGGYRVVVGWRTTREQRGTIEVYEVSARDGSRINAVAVPVLLAPSGG